MDKAKIDAMMAASPNVAMPDGSIITCPARLSWPSLIEPSAGPNKPDDKRYRATALFPLGADLELLRKAALDAATKQFGPRLKAVLESGNFKKPLIDQALAASKEEAKTGAPSKAYVPGAFFCRLTTKRKIPILAPDLSVITDPDQIYPGMWCRFKITVRAYDQNGGMGVSFDLAGVQKVADDDRLGGGGVSATDGFGAIAGATGSGTGAAANMSAAF